MLRVLINLPCLSPKMNTHTKPYHYDMRLSAMDWNEHFDREVTSHNDRVVGSRGGGGVGVFVCVLQAASWNSGPEKKSVAFVQDIRMLIIEQNMSDRPAEEDSLVGVKALEDNSSDEYSKLSALPFLLWSLCRLWITCTPYFCLI